MARALRATLQDDGWTVRLHADSTEALRVVDHADDATGSRTLYICPPVPRPCAVGVDLLLKGRAGGVLTEDLIESISDVLRAMDEGRALTPLSIIEAAGRAPCLSYRQSVVLRRVLSGTTNVAIAKELSVSVATVKRTLGELYDSFEVRSVTQLAARSRALGFELEP